MILFRLMALTLLLVAAALPNCGSAEAETPGSLTPAQAAEVNTLIHDYLLAHPDVMNEALVKADAAAKQAELDSAKQAVIEHQHDLEADPTSPVMGNPNGDVTLVEFFDYRCPYCKATDATVQTLLQQDSKLRLVLKEFPILGQTSVILARAALVAQKHGKYSQFNRAVWGSKGPFTEATALDAAKAIGLDPDQVKAESNDPAIDAILKSNQQLAIALGINGTPAFIVGHELIAGATTLDALKQSIAQARKG